MHSSPDLKDVPLIGDFAKTERQRQILKLVISRQVMGRPFMAPPGLPADRAAALRTAFDETMKDPEFVKEATARGQEVNPVSGADVDKLIASSTRRRRTWSRKRRRRSGGSSAPPRYFVSDCSSIPGGAVGISSAAMAICGASVTGATCAGFISSRTAFTALTMFV